MGRPSVWMVTLAVAAGGFAAACGDPLGPLESGLYVLREVDGAPLPVSIRATEVERWALLSDTLELGADGRFRRARVRRVIDFRVGTTEDAVERWEGKVVRSGDVHVLRQDVCDDMSLALCVAPDTVRFEGGAVLVRTMIEPGTRLRFEPVG